MSASLRAHQADAGSASTRLAAQDSPRSFGEAARAFFRYPSPLVLAAFALLAFVARLFLGPPGWGDALVAVGIVLWWPAQEWLLHRHLLHLPPLRILGRRIDFEFARRHRAHHREPWRADLIFLPVWVHMLGPLLALLFVWLLPTPALATTAMLAFTLMALQYEWLHFLVHTRVWPRLGYAQQLWRNHRLHHFKNERYWFGFTVVEVDRLMRTAPDPRRVATSGTCRTLGYD